MTNSEMIRNMTDEELADYIYAVYLSGKLEARYNMVGMFSDTVVYTDWLKEEAVDD